MKTVCYYPGDKFFIFDSDLVPDKHFALYGYETPMFAFLNSHLLPTDIAFLRMESNGSNGFACIVYCLDDEMLLKLPPFQPYDDDDGCPF